MCSVMDSIHCCIVSCCSEGAQTAVTHDSRSSMPDLRNIGLCVLIFAVVSLLIFLSIYSLTTSELVVNNDNNHYSITVQKM